LHGAQGIEHRAWGMAESGERRVTGLKGCKISGMEHRAWGWDMEDSVKEQKAGN